MATATKTDDAVPPPVETRNTEEAAREAAKLAHLRYVHDTMPGIRRELKSGDESGKEFRYVGPTGDEIRDEATLARIRSLAIPPAYADVWICPAANGHLQATGRDAKGRKQYRYHPKWRETRDENKYDKMLAFGEVLPALRERVDRDLARSGMPRAKVLAVVVRLLETTRIRVGNEEYAEENNSYGLTTLRNRHIEVEGGTLHFRFRGKSGKDHEIDLHDRKLANIVRKLRDLPGQELFQYVDGETGEAHRVTSHDVNEYLREITGGDFTAKDFRTWAGTVLCALTLQGFEEFDGESVAKKNIVAAIEAVSERLGNTPTVCRKCYVHPAILDAYLEGDMARTLEAASATTTTEKDGPALTAEERAVMALLQTRLVASPPGSSKRGEGKKPLMKKAA